MKIYKVIIPFCLSIIFLVIPASALTVTTALDAGPGSLREAVANIPADGTITFDVTLDGGTIVFGGSRIVIEKNLTIDATGLPGGLTLHANNLSRVFDISHDIFGPLDPPKVELKGLTITGGATAAGFDGGAIYNWGHLTMTGCHLTGNAVDFERGGAIFNEGTLVLNSCEFVGNRAPTGRGGAIYTIGPVTMTDCLFGSNGAQNGGAMSASEESVLTVTNCEFTQNEGTFGGAIVCDSSSSLTLSGCEFSNNFSMQGGAIFSGAVQLKMRQCHFAGNSASSSGGAVSASDGPVEAVNCLFTGNEAEFGGAIYSSDLSLINCTFFENLAYTSGGAVWNNEGATLINCILWGNGTEISGDPIGGESSHNLIQGVGGATDPLFVDPGARNVRLQPGSPAINVGLNEANSELLDLDGNPRKLGFIDLGVYESNIPEATEYLTWAADHGLAYGVHHESADNPDGDQFSNLEEFGFGLDPLDPSDGPVFARQMVPDEGTEYYTLTIPTRTGAVFSGSPNPTATVDGITYTIEGSLDLQTYSVPVERIDFASDLTPPGGWSATTFRLLGGVSGPQGFLRVRVSN